ncbi:conserved hypothetical protein [Prochlorococcus marinus str. MIT 9312]|uniref:Uncharacterized protein n=1 Tax=Prochlorococcus marinus (strain MIT 9312) TaxID=74546 RepID=Q31B85_PROM9|nr:hypothetical protein [Prochlorococcus marinus]ABB49860.1 conserved hypothetical protein [Prochlorococcus marinus str. MIT 9312]KGF99152.1 hypothetical protein EU97_1710 [Prochlorococcus marinus str. MIT 9311]
MKKDTSNSFKPEKGMEVTYEELHIRHITLLIDIKNKELNNWFLKMAIINTFDDLKIFLNNLKKNKNKCIIAICGNEIIGYMNIFPLNKKETCLKISKPKLINNNCSFTEKQLTLGLIKKSISITDIKTSSWIINSEINNIDLISTSRELGFQPLGEIILWDGCDLNESIKQNTQDYELINEFHNINKKNILSIVNFIRSNQSPLIRNILDFDQDDILKRNNSKSGALVYENSVLCTILKDINYQNDEIYTLTISRYWDNRLNSILKEFIKRFFVKSPMSYLKSYKENSQLNTFLEECNLKEKNQEIILIRNTIVKNEAKQVNKINQSLESIFDKLSPQNNPYPSPLPLKSK